MGSGSREAVGPACMCAVGALVCGSGGEQDGNSAAETIQLFFRVRESLSAGARSAVGVGRGERVRVRRAADGS